ncbi:hypothetical protein SUDANB145_02314 [Streptomyces sp. enrichment culture]|uniref:hypothetical protein n=1 Tax=Streptomyces sp. enrichment culture TaxID=1795815 RepID=UPI003F55EF59
MKRHSLPVTVVLTATAALLLTACGAGEDKPSGNDRIAGTDQSSRETAEPAGTEKDKPEKKNEMTTMGDGSNFIN